MVNMELYKVFYAVAKTGNLSKASKELFISQPAVSYAIKQLETQLGGRLFTRTPKGVILTPEGEAVYRHVEKGFMELVNAENEFSLIKGLESGVVTIGASDTVSKYFLMNHIAAFHGLYPHIDIKIINRTTDEIISLIKNGKADVGFINVQKGVSYEDISLHSCGELRECFVASPDLIKGLQLPLSAAALAELPLMLLENKSSTRRAIEDAITSYGVTLKPVFELCSVDLIVECAKIGLGFGCVTREYVQKEINDGSLVEVPLSFALPKRDICMATRAGLTPTFAGAKLKEYFEKNR